MLAWPRLSVAALLPALVMMASCSGDGGGGGTIVFTDGTVPTADAIRVDFAVVDLASVPDTLPTNTDGPVIEILEPQADAIIVGGVLEVQAKITDDEGIDAQTVVVTLQGDSEPIPMGLTATPDTYDALIDVSDLSGSARLWVVAGDLVGNENSEIVEFERDPGPVVQFLSPGDESRHKGSVSLQLIVADASEITDFDVRIGTEPLALTQTVSASDRQVWAGTVDFDDPVFGLPLSGRQVLTATATNANGATTIEQRLFFVDDEGPEIAIASQEAGDLIGGIIELEATITDLAGVLPSSVRCVIGNNLQTRTVVLTADALSPGTYKGQFDTRTLTNKMLWPVMSFRAADKLGNENHRDIEVILDNGPPILDFDPPEDFHAIREKDGILQCSRPFDPVGADAADDLDGVPQIIDMRIRIEDQSNDVPSAEWSIVAGTDPETVWLYVLHGDVGKPVVVDTDGDGFCDAINPEVIPEGSTPQPGEAVAVNLAEIDPGGQPDYRPLLNPPNPPAFCASWGDETDQPDGLCDTVPKSFSFAISYLTSSQAALWSIPPIIVGNKLQCVGSPFDFLANDLPDGWVCVGAQARDNLGNLGVSMPMRLWVDLDRPFVGKFSASGAPPAPDCTGTLNSATGEVTSAPCTFRPRGQAFPQVFRQTWGRRFD